MSHSGGLALSLSDTDAAPRYRVLGSLRVTVGGEDRTPAPPKMRRLLALLIVRAGETVPSEKIVEELWGERPPRRATASLHVYVSQLRKLLTVPGVPSPIVTSTPGYTLRAQEGHLDVREFERLYGHGRAGFSVGDYEAAAAILAEALLMWRGPVLEGISGSLEIDSFTAVAEEKRLNCLETRIECDLVLGRHHELVEELNGLVLQHPLREPFYRQLMTALYCAGRQGDALGVYRSARQLIRDELGVEPGRTLRAAQEAILREDTKRLAAVGAPLSA